MALTPRQRCAVCVWRLGLVAALVALAVWPTVDAAPPQQRTKQQPKNFGLGDAMVFLKKYGYLNKGSATEGPSGALLSEETFKDAIKAYQAFSGLPVTGNLDAATMQLMRTPRCGVKDVDPEEPVKGRQKRYALEGSTWSKHKLTYHVSQPLTSLSSEPAASGGGGLGSWLGSWLGLGGGGKGVSKGVKGKWLAAEAAEAAVGRALGVWARHSLLAFARFEDGGAKGQVGRGAPDVDVRFERGAHGHCDDFDGRGGTLAHAYYPRFGGDAHFDADEHWTLGEYRGTNFFQVAVHEFGHSLGLRHSDHPDAVMAPVYRGYDPNFELHEDDIDAIQALYGRRSYSNIQAVDQTQQQQDDDDVGQGQESEDENDDGKRSEEEDSGNKGQKDHGPEDEEENSKDESDEDKGEDGEEPAVIPANLLCDDPTVDVMFNTPDGDIYVLKGAWYYRLGATGGVLPGSPRPLAERWPGLPAHVDAAFASASGKTYFFKGTLYWRYDGAVSPASLDAGFPRRIDQGLPGAPDAPDAALLRPADGRLYLFKGAEFWQYEPNRNSVGGGTFIPKPLSQWKGVPSGLDAAFFHGGYTYFFKGGLYYRFDDVAFKVDEGSPSFPRSSAAWWFGCGPTAHAREQQTRARTHR